MWRATLGSATAATTVWDVGCPPPPPLAILRVRADGRGGKKGRPKLIKIVRDSRGNAVCRVCEKQPSASVKLKAGLCRTCRHLLSRSFPCFLLLVLPHCE